MKAIILAGGLGTRLTEETQLKPKPMVEIGNKPIIWHIMKIFHSYGIKEFIILGGYKVEVIKEYFLNYNSLSSDVTVNLKSGKVKIHNSNCEDWDVTILDTGKHTMTGARIAKAKQIIGNNTFLLTYGDGVGNINIEKLIKAHKEYGGLVTLTSAQPDGRFGALKFNESMKVLKFEEKPKGDGTWINAGFMVCEPGFFDYLSVDDKCVLEQEPLRNCSKNGELFTYQHKGFWMPMDTLRDKNILSNLWNKNQAKWKTWN